MADICEICMEFVGFWEEGTHIDYDNYVLCSKCHEEVELLYEKCDGEKDFEECIKEVRKKKNEKTSNNLSDKRIA